MVPEVLETRKFLDSLSWSSYLHPGEDIYDIMDKIQQEYGDSLEDSPIFRGDVFNQITTDEFVDYLRDKGFSIWEEHITRYTVGRMNKS